VDPQIVTIAVSSIFSVGASWAILNQRVKALEEKQAKQDDHAERLIRLETKLDILIQKLKGNNL
jgi:uncharacterized coiled-coil protein SlyX